MAVFRRIEQTPAPAQAAHGGNTDLPQRAGMSLDEDERLDSDAEVGHSSP